jgi:sec-independent protein translocase protein TatC
MAKTRDLFDDSTMTFGEHLEALRTHLWKALIGLTLGTVVTLYFGEHVVALIRYPIDQALREHGIRATQDVQTGWSFGDYWAWFTSEEPEQQPERAEPEKPEQPRDTIVVKIRAAELAQALHDVDPDRHPAPSDAEKDATVNLAIQAPEFAQFQSTLDRAIDAMERPIALTVQESFMVYLKVSLVAGLVLSSPWVFYQLWLFVAAGLYPHERKYVYIYLPMSLTLFLVGVVFCFFAVFPLVLDFLLEFSRWMGVTPQIRLSEWVTFAIMLPLMFGLSFQLPLVMLFLEKISIFEANDYREKRRIAILAISIISMVLTPAEPISMIAMMVPLIILYELGIVLCDLSPAPKSPFEAETA